jgi:hypothetical protein
MGTVRQILSLGMIFDFSGQNLLKFVNQGSGENHSPTLSVN